MQPIIEIIKLLISYRRNPYLQFSAFLVTSGCILLTTSILEIVIRFGYETIQPNKGQLDFNDNISTVVGIALVLAGLILFYVKFLKKETPNKEHEKDSQLIEEIFKKITSLNKLDMFIDKALYPYLYDPVLTDFETFQYFKQSSHYHVYDEKLSKLLDQFYHAWGTIYSYYEAFTETRNEDMLRPDTVMDIATRKEVEIAIEEVPKAAKAMYAIQKDLLRYIRNNYKNIDI